MSPLRPIGGALVLCGALVAGGCIAHVANLGDAPPVVASTSPSPGSSPTAGSTGSCSITTRDPAATIVISIDPDFAAATTTYGEVYGYAQYDPVGMEAPPAVATAVAATTSDLVVFANYDPGLIAHSATGFPGVSAFPAEPYPFPTADTSAVASTITSAAWSTGSLESFGNTSSTICYSQTFTAPAAGTFFFGDDPLYNSPSSFRGVLTVSN